MILSRIRIRPDYPSLAKLASIALSNSYGRHQVLWSLFEDSRRFLYHEEPPRRGGSPTPTYYTLSEIEPKGDSELFAIETKQFEPVISKHDQLSFSLRANPIIKRKRQSNKNSAKHDVIMDAQRSFLLSLVGDDHGTHESSAVHRSELYRRANELVQSDQSLFAKHVKSWFDDDQVNAVMSRVAEMSTTDALRDTTFLVGNVAARRWLERKAARMGFRLIEPARTLTTEGYMRHTFQKARKRGSRPVTFSSIDFHGVLEVADPELFSRALTEGIGSAKGFGCGLMLVKRLR